jgi:hypothetical protein
MTDTKTPEKDKLQSIDTLSASTLRELVARATARLSTLDQAERAEKIKVAQAIIDAYGLGTAELKLKGGTKAKRSSGKKSSGTSEGTDQKPYRLPDGTQFDNRGGGKEELADEVKREIEAHPEAATATGDALKKIQAAARKTVYRRYPNPDYPGNQTA